MRVPTCRRRHADADADADMTTCCVACKSEPSEELRLAADRIHLLHLNTPAEEETTPGPGGYISAPVNGFTVGIRRHSLLQYIVRLGSCR